MIHPGAPSTDWATMEWSYPEPPATFGVSVLGRRRGREGIFNAVLTVQAQDRLAAIFAGHLFAEALMPKGRGWRDVKVRVSSGVAADPRRVMPGEEE